MRKTRILALGCVVTVGACALLIATGMLLNLRTPSPTDLSVSGQLATPPPGLSESVTLRVVTMNVWGLKHLSSHRAERMPAIGARLAELNPDLIGFQEAFVKADRDALLIPLRKAGLEHHRYFPSGLVGSGLLVVSRYPIEEAFFFRYSAGGKPHRVDHGDWWA
ncbi:MAG: endonuclease/exonuclease/phosphatase family protein, partial [Lentisphaeria bacterium]|nr:endonuclease/exonuclease/phosphatase family protein [Lentisphaeria bacterium]